MHPIFSAILKLLDFCLYFFDIVSDVLTTKLYYDNCHYYYLAFSISILASSYITTVIFLIWVVHEKEKWYKALAYPFITTFIVFKKILNKLPFSKYSQKGRASPGLLLAPLAACKCVWVCIWSVRVSPCPSGSGTRCGWVLYIVQCIRCGKVWYKV